jgi:hypothetical protein
LSLYSAANSKSAPLVLSAAATNNTVAHTAQADSSHSESPEVGVHEGQPALRQRNGFLRHERLAHEGSQVEGALADAVVGAHLPARVTNRMNRFTAETADHVLVPYRLQKINEERSSKFDTTFHDDVMMTCDCTPAASRCHKVMKMKCTYEFQAVVLRGEIDLEPFEQKGGQGE